MYTTHTLCTAPVRVNEIKNELGGGAASLSHQQLPISTCQSIPLPISEKEKKSATQSCK